MPNSTRYVFPDESQRLIYTPGARRGSAFTSLRGTELFVYSDAKGTILAPIDDLNNNPILDSKLTTDASSLIPSFHGPPGIRDLYLKIAGTSSIIPISANVTSQIAAVEAAIGVYSSEPFVHDQYVPSDTWTIPHPLNHRPIVLLVDSAGSEFLPAEIFYPSMSLVVITMTDAQGGFAYLT